MQYVAFGCLVLAGLLTIAGLALPLALIIGLIEAIFSVMF